MNTKCNTEHLAFQGLGRREVVGCFDGGDLSSDGGGLLLREVEQRTQILRRLSRCFTDRRDPSRIEHSVESLVTQRVPRIALGGNAYFVNANIMLAIPGRTIHEKCGLVFVLAR